MTITHLEIHHLSIPLRVPLKTACGTEESIDTVLIRACTGDHAAWVETCPLRLPLYTPECANSVFGQITELFGPRIIRKPLESARAVGGLLQPFRGNSFARAGLDLCWWALESQRNGTSIRALFGGRDTSIKVRPSLGIYDSIDDLLGEVDHHVQGGADEIKFKIAGNWNVDVIREVRRSFPRLGMAVDGNCAFTLNDVPMLTALAEFRLTMVEQPFHEHDLFAHKRLRSLIETPVCLDESIAELSDAQIAVREHACDRISIKIGRVGGLTTALDIYRVCKDNNVDCYVGGMWESGVGTALNIELATVMDDDCRHGITLPVHTHCIDIVDPVVEIDAEWRIQPTNAAYIGRNLKQRTIEKFTLKKKIVR